MDTYRGTNQKFHLYLAYFLLNKKNKNSIYLIHLFPILFTAFSIFYLCLCTEHRSFFTKILYFTEVSSASPTPPFTHLPMTIADVLQSDSLKSDKKPLIDEL